MQHLGLHLDMELNSNKISIHACGFYCFNGPNVNKTSHNVAKYFAIHAHRTNIILHQGWAFCLNIH